MKKNYFLFLVLSAFLFASCEPNIPKNQNKSINLSGASTTTATSGGDSKKINNIVSSTKQKEAKQKIVKNNATKSTNGKIGVSNGNKFIAFVGTYCPHCQAAVPVFEKFATETNGKIEINVIDKQSFPGVKNLKQNYTNPKSYKDYTNEYCGYIPSYVIVDKNGKVIEKKCGGSLDYNQLKLKLLKNNSNKMIVKIGDNIAVDYIGKFTDGKVFDTSIEEVAKKANIYNSARTYKPLEFQVGAGQMIKCFDKGVVGMKKGETKEIVCEPKDAYGECDPKKIIKVEKSKLADFEKNGYKLEKGVELPTQYGMLKITDVKDNMVYLDTNHPMCGKKLIFTVTVKDIR